MVGMVEMCLSLAWLFRSIDKHFSFFVFVHLLVLFLIKISSMGYSEIQIIVLKLMWHSNLTINTPEIQNKVVHGERTPGL